MATVGLFLALGQVDGLLHRLQAEGAAAAGLQSLVFGWPDGELFSRAEAVIEFWNEEQQAAFAERSIWAYTGLDVAFIVVYSWLFLALLYRLTPEGAPPAGAGWLSERARKPWPWIAGLAIVDLVEDVLLAFVATEIGSGRGWLYACLIFSAVKWLGVLLVLGLVVGVLRERGAWFGGLLREVRDAVWQLRAPALLSGAFGLLLLGDPTGQAPDLLRRWMDSSGTWVWSVLTTLVFTIVLWGAARRILLGVGSPKPALNEPVILVAGAVLVVLGFLFELTRLAGVGSLVLGVWAAGGLRWPLGGPTQAARVAAADGDRDASARFPGDADAREPAAERSLRVIQRTARAIAVWPLVALGLAVASAFTAPPLVLAGSDTGGESADWATIGIALLGLAGAVVAAGVGTRVLRSIDDSFGTGGAWLVTVPLGIAAAILLAFAIAEPLEKAPAVGAVAILAAMFTVLTSALGELERQAEIRTPPAGIVALGFRRTPVLLLLLSGLVVASLVSPHDDHHDVAVRAGPRPAKVEVSTAWRAWVRQNCARSHGGPIPLVIVGAHGGGVRAAFWTAATMTALIPEPQKRLVRHCGRVSRIPVLNQMFAMSGISGGSLGLTSYAAWAAQPNGAEWYEAALGKPDFLASPVAWLAVDGARAYIGFEADDRAGLLERAWERHGPDLDEDFFAGRKEPPYLLLGGATVDSGCRVNVSPLRLSEPLSASISPSTAECAAIEGRASTVGSTNAPPAAQTTEILDHLCPPSARLRRSTASLLSARFPYVSPSGRLPSCDEKDESAIAVVDGGYVEGTGASAALDLWRQLEPLVARHNRAASRRLRRRGRLVVPIYVQLDNHYTAVAAAAPAGRTEELLAPPTAKLRADANDDRAIEQEIRATFLAAVPGFTGRTCTVGYDRDGAIGRYVRIAPVVSPGLPAPLAWTLSRMSRDDLLLQRGRALQGAGAAAVAQILAGKRQIACGLPKEQSLARPFGEQAPRRFADRFRAQLQRLSRR